MAAPQPKLIASELVQKLNDARILHSDNRGESIAQAEFRVQALKARHLSAYYAVRSMIFALKGDAEGLEETAADFLGQDSFDITSGMNVLRSLSARGHGDSAERLALELVDLIGPDMWLATQITDCLLVTPNFTGLSAVVAKHSAAHGKEPEQYPDARLVESLSEVGVDEDGMRHFLSTAASTLTNRGYDLAPISIAEATRLSDDDATRAIIRFSVSLPCEQVFDIEDSLMDELISAQSAAFTAGAIAVSVMPYRSTDE